MKRITINNLLSIAVISSLLVACNSSSNENQSTSSSIGKAADDYIAGATVCADVNNNSIADDGAENCVQTDAQGNFRFSTVRTEPLVMSGGVDIGTGQEFRGSLMAPTGSTIINPLTTLISSVQKEGNVTAQEAQEIVKNSLGLNSSNTSLTTLNSYKKNSLASAPNFYIDLTRFDPLAGLQFGTNTTTRERAQQVLIQQTTIQVILTITATTISASSRNIDHRIVTIEASNQIARLMVSPSNINRPLQISSEETIQTIVEETAQQTFSENTESNREALASVGAVQDVVARQIRAVTQTVSTNIGAVSVNSPESALRAIRASNAGVLLVTDNQSEDSVASIIQEAVSTGETEALASVDIETEIDSSEANLIERPEITQPEIVRPTGGEGGTA